MEDSTKSETTASAESRTRRRAIFVVGSRIAFVAYLILLSVLLLTRDPDDLVPVSMTLLDLLGSVSHLLSFLVLSVLAMAARWSSTAWGTGLLLVAYATGTELLQGLVPPRTPEWGDWFQDLAGIAIGVTIYRSATIARQRFVKSAGACGNKTSGVKKAD